MGDIYFSFGFSKQFGYLLTNEWGVQVTSNSYGSSTLDNDGMDAGSREADYIHSGFGERHDAALLDRQRRTGLRHGDGAGAGARDPGRRVDATSARPAGTRSTNYSQVVDNDVIEWSNRGPGANGRNGVDVVADGSYAPGDATLNTIIDGRNAWTTWGGTSRSTPVAVGEAALIYQAYKAAHGSLPDRADGRRRSSSRRRNDLGYDNFTQGAGSIDAGRAVAAAAGSGTTVSPDEWRPATSRHEPARSRRRSRRASPRRRRSRSAARATCRSPTGCCTSTRRSRSVHEQRRSRRSRRELQRARLPDQHHDNIKAHADADLVVIRATYPHDKFDGNNDYQSDQAWRLLAYNWTDINHDGRLWKDSNGNGVVNHADKSTSSNIDGFNDIDFRHSEMEQGEYERFFYHRPGSNVLMGFIHHPAQRMANGIYLGFQHSTRNPAIDVTDFKIEIDYYKNVDWPWVTETQPSGNTFSATINVPSNAPSGMYEGSIVASKGSTVDRRPGRRDRRADGAAGAGRLALLGAHVRRLGCRRRAERPALQQRLDLRRQRLDLA